MEQSQEIPALNEETGLPKQLKTLCILSLIMGGLLIIMLLFAIKQHYFPSEDDKIKMAENMEKILAVNPNIDEIQDMMEKAGPNACAGLLTQVLSVIGVILMLKLKKVGFYLYIVAELLPYVFTIVLVGFIGLYGPFAMLGEKLKMLGVAYAIISVILDFLFIFLYSKH